MLPLRPALRLSLLAAALIAANLVYAEVPAGAPFTPEQQQLIRQLSVSEAKAMTPQIASEALVIVAKTTEGQTLQVAKEALEVGRKSVDWWLTALGLLMAVAGIGLPIWLGRKHDEVEIKLREADAAKQKAEIAQRHAEQLLENFNKQTSLIPNADEITGKLSNEVLEKLHKVKPPQVVTLIEQAWDAHRRKDWKTAKPLWELLSLIEGHDYNVWFNLGLTLVRTNQDWQTAASCFERSHLLKPSSYALNNWGNVLGNWAKKLSGKEQEQRFTEACDKFAEAIRIKPDDVAAYNNWGSTLGNWAMTLSGEMKKQRFAESEEKFAMAIQYKPDDEDIYTNWALTLKYWAETLEGEERDAKLAKAAKYQQLADELKGKRN